MGTRQHTLYLSIANGTSVGICLSSCITGTYIPAAANWHSAGAGRYNALRTGSRYFGIARSTLYRWLHKIQDETLPVRQMRADNRCCWGGVWPLLKCKI